MEKTCSVCKNWGYAWSKDQARNCQIDVELARRAYPQKRADQTCFMWKAKQCEPSPDMVLGFPVVYVERSPDAPPAEDIICGSWDDVHVGIVRSGW